MIRSALGTLICVLRWTVELAAVRCLELLRLFSVAEHLLAGSTRYDCYVQCAGWQCRSVKVDNGCCGGHKLSPSCDLSVAGLMVVVAPALGFLHAVSLKPSPPVPRSDPLMAEGTDQGQRRSAAPFNLSTILIPARFLNATSVDAESLDRPRFTRLHCLLQLRVINQ